MSNDPMKNQSPFVPPTPSIDILPTYDVNLPKGTPEIDLPIEDGIKLIDETVNEINLLINHPFIELRKDCGKPINQDKKYIKISFDQAEIIEDIKRNGIYGKVLSKIIKIVGGLPVWANQFQTAFPHLVQIISKTIDGNKTPICLPTDRDYATKNNCHGKIDTYYYSDSWKRKWANTLIVGSAQCGKTGPLIVSCLNNIIFNAVFSNEIFKGQMQPILGLFLSPARTEIHSNFIKDFNDFREIFGLLKIKIEFFDNSKNLIPDQSIEVRMEDQFVFWKNFIKHRLEHVKQKLYTALLANGETADEDGSFKEEEVLDRADFWLNYVFGSLDNLKMIQKLKSETRATILESVGLRLLDYKIMGRLCTLGEVTTNFHIDETHHSATNNSQIVKIIKAAHADEDNSSTFISGITWTPIMFKDVDTFYWMFFRYPNKLRLHGIPMYDGIYFHHDSTLVDIPQIMDWEEIADLFDLPDLKNLDLTALMDQSDFDAKKLDHERNPVGDFGDDRCIAKEVHDTAYRAGVVSIKPQRGRPYLPTEKDFGSYTDYDDYTTRVWEAFAKTPFTFWLHESQSNPDGGRHQWVCPQSNKIQKSMAIIKLNDFMEVQEFTKKLQVERDKFFETTGINTRIVHYDSGKKTASKSKNFMDWYSSFGPLQSEPPFSDDEHIIILITGSMRMGVRIPGRSQLCFDSSHYNYKADTDAPLQGLVARHWGYNKGTPLSIVSPANALFWASYIKQNGNVLQSPKGVVRLDLSKGSDLEVDFKTALAVARTGGFNSILVALNSLNADISSYSKTKFSSRPTGNAGDKFQLSKQITNNGHLYSILNNRNYLDQLGIACGLQNNHKILGIGQTCQRTRNGLNVPATYLTHGMQNAVRLQARWEWMTSYGNTSTLIQGNQHPSTPPNQILAVLVQGRWLDNHGNYIDKNYAGPGQSEILKLYFPILKPIGGVQNVSTEVINLPLPDSLGGNIQSEPQSEKHKEEHGVAGKKTAPLNPPKYPDA